MPPVYEYECPKHGVFEYPQSFREPPLERCPKCKKPVKKVPSCPAPAKIR